MTDPRPMPNYDRYEKARQEVQALTHQRGGELGSRQVLALLEWVVGEMALLREEMEAERVYRTEKEDSNA